MLQSSPPENTRDSTRVFVISGVTSCNIGVSYFPYVICVNSHRRHVKSYWLRVVLLSQLDNDCLDLPITSRVCGLSELPITSRVCGLFTLE